MNDATATYSHTWHGGVLGSRNPAQGGAGQDRDGTDACLLVHGAEEIPPVLDDAPSDRALSASRTVSPDQDPHLHQPHQHGHLQEPHPRNTRHVRTCSHT